MGMYNEVFKKCPECGDICEIQIPQIILGFGGFNLNDPESLMDLSKDELIQLRSYLKGEIFFCKCGNYFSSNSQSDDVKRAIISDIIGNKESEDEEA